MIGAMTEMNKETISSDPLTLGADSSNSLPLVGLPNSVLRKDGKSILLLTMLQAKGLNRDLKRSLTEGPEQIPDQVAGLALGDLPKSLSETDRRLLRRLANPIARMARYWVAMKPPKRGLLKHDAHDYSTAVDLLWLEDYAPDWKTLKADENELLAICPAWQNIQTGIKKSLPPTLVRPDFGVFMLWPRILKDLEKWSGLDDERQIAVGRAVFALSSISLSDWFAREAVRICPDLAEEFFLPPADVDHPSEPQDDIGNESIDQDGGWSELLERLDALAIELRDAPTQMTVSALQALAQEFGDAAHALPVGGQSSRELLAEKINGLMNVCRRLAMDPDFSWLDAGLLGQIEARWQLALTDAGEDTSALLDDAGAATGRVEQAAGTLRTMTAEKQAAEAELARKGEDIVSAKTVVERRTLEQHRREKQKDLLILDEQITARQDDLLAAGSPFGEAFDYAMDYQALLQDAPEHPPEPDPVREIEPYKPLSDTPVSPGTTPIQQAGGQVASGEVVVPAPVPESESSVSPSTGQPDQVHEKPQVQGNATPVSTTPPSPEVSQNPKDEVYNDQAGDACQPIWQLLADGRFSMACQLVRAMSAQEDAPQMPPQTLLEAITLADALTLPDGNLHDAVAARLQEFSEEWFHEEGPDSWHTALNLLLVASTLRPMVLAPDSGASVIAGYLHLDSQGRYPNLWKLVGSIRESSERLRGFRIDLASLRSARDQAAIATGLQSLQQEARVWLKSQAPAMTIKFAPATKVWHQWLRPDGVIHRLVSPIIENRAAAAGEVASLIKSLADSANFQKLVRKADRVDNDRRKGDDIHSGALDHLSRCSEDAIALARRWLPFIEARSPSNDRMRELLLQIRKEIEQLLPSVNCELVQPESGRWQLVACAQKAVLRQLNGLVGIFDPNSPPLAASEAAATEVLAKDLLDVPAIRVAPNWAIESTAPDVIAAIRQWCSDPLSWKNAFDARLNAGDLSGAKRLLDRRDVEVEDLGLIDLLRRETESWRSKLKSRVLDCRRDIEVGSAYGYVSDTERNQYERELVRIEARSEESPRFDIALESIERIRNAIRTNRAEKAHLIKQAVVELEHEQRNPEDIQAVQASLDEGDMATAHELLQRVRRGLSAWPEEVTTVDSFQSFVSSLAELDEWFATRRNSDEIRTAIKNGALPGLDFRKVAGAQRDQAANMFVDWSFLKSRKAGDAGKLHSLLSALGFVAGRPPSKQEALPSKEIWMLSADPISDRSICPIPHFGSAAKGAYRLICLWERPIEDDIVQLVGDSNLHRATIVLYFGRMTERKWRELSRKTKLARKSFVLIDEMVLLFLAAQAGSRLAALFSTSLPYSFADPFDATAGFVPPEMFYGRAAELDAILGLNGRCFIYGGRQLGKTALMRRAEQTFHAPDKGRWSHYVDLRAEGVGVNRTASEVWQTIAAAMKAVGMLAEAPTAAELAKKSGIDDLLETIRSFLGKNDERRMLLLLDEADRFFEQDGRNDFAETRRLKQLMDTTQRRFKVVFAGLHNVLRMTERANHPLAHFGQPIKIGPFIEEHEIREARELIRLPLAAAGFEFESRSLVMRILAQTNYYPSLIQLYCNHLLQHMLTRLATAQRLAGPRYRITNHDIEAVYSSSDLRGEIRAKFNFTLQLDPRYEVIAYGMAYEALSGRFGQVDGMDWRSIWLDCAMTWWSEGFRETSELDFRVLLDEMVELGVLSRFSTGRYGLRNPNVFLLLGNRDEIETVLARTRQPAVEFDSAVFHPQLRIQNGSHLRHPLTFQQLSEILRHGNTVTAIAGTAAADIEELGGCLKAFVEQSGTGVCHVIDGVVDHQAFAAQLNALVEKRDKKGHTVIVVPSSVPWAGLWVSEAKEKLSHLKSPTGYVAVCFIADPNTLWGTFSDDKLNELGIPWISLLPWRETFVHQYLEDQQLLMTTETIRDATGFWPGLLYPLVDKCTQVRDLERHAKTAKEMLKDHHAAEKLFAKFGLNVAVTVPVLRTLAELGQASEPGDLSEFSEVPIDMVNRVLAWGELLGIARREGAHYWRLDEVVEQILLSVRE